MHTFISASETARNFEISASTCRRILKKANLKSRRPFRGPILKLRHKRARLERCRSCVDWSQEDWSRVLFSDECRFSLDSDDGRARVWRTNGSRLHPKNIMQHDRWRSKSVMVWGGISSNFRTRLVIVQGNLNSEGYVSKILRDVVLPFKAAYPSVMAFQHDNARCHSSRFTKDFLRTHNIVTLPWPALSPDLNPIEHQWDAMKRRIRVLNPQNIDELVDCICYVQYISLTEVNR